jgi:hypothetical protein
MRTSNLLIVVAKKSLMALWEWDDQQSVVAKKSVMALWEWDDQQSVVA